MKILKFIVLSLIKNAFGNQKIESIHFYSWPPKQNALPKVLIITPQADRNYLFPPSGVCFANVFCFWRKQRCTKWCSNSVVNTQLKTTLSLHVFDSKSILTYLEDIIPICWCFEKSKNSLAKTW